MDQHMPAARVYATARRLVRELPPHWRRRLRRGWRRLQGKPPESVRRRQAKPRSSTRPKLSVVVATRNSERYVVECLDSLLGQTLPRLQVVVVDDGSSDDTVVRVRQVAASDSRIVLLQQPREGIGAARNRGAAAATGKFLAFVDPADTIPVTAYRLMVRSLVRSRSDFVIGSLSRRRFDRALRRPGWVGVVHDRDRIGTSIDEFPAAMQDTLMGNRVFRRSFWLDRVGAFLEDNPDADSVAAVIALIRASRFDVLRAVTLHWQERPAPGALTREQSDLVQLQQRLGAIESAWHVIGEEASPQVRRAWLVGLLDSTLGAYVESADFTDSAFLARLEQAAGFYRQAATAADWVSVPLDRRLRVELAAEGRWTEVQELLEYFRLNGAIPPTRVVDGRVYGELSFLDPQPRLPDLELAPVQTPLTGCVLRSTWQPDGALLVEGWAYVRGVDLSDAPPKIEVWLTDPQTGAEVPLQAEQQVEPEADLVANQPNQSYANGGFRVLVDVERLWRGTVREQVRWQMIVRVDAGGVQRTDALRLQLRRATARRMSARELDGPGGSARVVPAFSSTDGFCLLVLRDWCRAVQLQVEGARVQATIRALRSTGRIVALELRGPTSVIRCPATPTGDGLWSFEGDLPVGTRPAEWAVRAVDGAGRAHRVPWPAGSTVGRSIGGGPGQAGWHRSARGYCDLTTDLRAVEVMEVAVTAESVALTVRTWGVSTTELQLAELRSPRATVVASEVITADEEHHMVRLPLHASLWGQPRLPLPSGSYTVAIPGGELVAGVAPELVDRLPLDGMTPWHAWTVGRVPGTVDLALDLTAPLSKQARSRYGQEQLARAYQGTDYQPRDAVLFQCYRGEFATDSQRAIHEELHRRGTPLELLWAVSDHAVSLPEGAVPLLIGSPAWYDAVGESRFLCQNNDFDRFFRHRPHQRYLQTFHGHPFKSMGISFLEAWGKTPWVIDTEVKRRTDAWDAILVPSEACVEMYRREYRYTKEILVTGYPRDDALVTTDSAEARPRILRTLGVDQNTTVVLYAPTWRDTVSTGAFKAKIFDALDLDLLAAALGPDYTLLLRGHSYNLREGASRRAASLLDVSSYPEVNDLILAADVAVLDYSSLRFDWMITEKPVVFFVPDLAEYLSARTVLFDFHSSAPGPLLSSTAQVVAALRDLPLVRDGYAAQRRAFNVTFNSLQDGKAAARVVDAFFS